MNSKAISIFSAVFVLLAIPYPIMRLNGDRTADLPAFGVLIMAMIMVGMLNSKITILEKTVKELKEDLKIAGKHPEDQ